MSLVTFKNCMSHFKPVIMSIIFLLFVLTDFQFYLIYFKSNDVQISVKRRRDTWRSRLKLHSRDVTRTKIARSTRSASKISFYDKRHSASITLLCMLWGKYTSFYLKVRLTVLFNTRGRFIVLNAKYKTIKGNYIQKTADLVIDLDVCFDYYSKCVTIDCIFDTDAICIS